MSAVIHLTINFLLLISIIFIMQYLSFISVSHSWMKATPSQISQSYSLYRAIVVVQPQCTWFIHGKYKKYILKPQEAMGGICHPRCRQHFTSKKNVGGREAGYSYISRNFIIPILSFDQMLELVCPLSNRMGILGVPHGDFGDLSNPIQHFLLAYF